MLWLSTLQRDWRRPASVGPSGRPWEALGMPWPTGNFSNTRPKTPFPILYTEGNVNGTWAKKRPQKTIAHFPLKRVL